MGSGQAAKQPLYSSGYFTCTASVSQPPVEPPYKKRDQPSPCPLKSFSIWGINS